MSLYLNSSFTPKSVTVSNIFVPSGSSLFISGNLVISGTSYLSEVFIDTSRVFTVGILNATDIYTSNLYGTASYAITASYALNGGSLTINTSSFVTNAQTSSMLTPYVLTSITSSMLNPYLLTTNTSSFVRNDQTSSMTVATSSYALSGPFASKTSNQFNGDQTITGSLIVSGTQTNIGPFINSGSTAISGTFQVNYGTNTQPAAQVNSNGVFVLGAYGSTPPAVAGGIYFDGTDFHLGFA